MALSPGPSLDMASSEENVEFPYFVIPGDAQQTTEMFTAHSEPFMQVDPPNIDVSDDDDSNYTWVDDAWNYGKEKINQVSEQITGTKPAAPEPAKPVDKKEEAKKLPETLDGKPSDKPESKPSSQPSQPQPTQNSREVEIKEMQALFKDPSDDLKSLMENFTYNGEISGTIDQQTSSYADSLSQVLNQILNTSITPNMILSTTYDDLVESIGLAAAYKSSLNKEAKLNYDDRMIALAKFLINS